MMHQRGFSLPEVLCALMLFTVSIILLLSYQRRLQQDTETQWQTRQVWRYAFEQSEPESPSLPEGWLIKKQQLPCENCLCISVKITSPLGCIGQLSKRICPFPKPNQE